MKLLKKISMYVIASVLIAITFIGFSPKNTYAASKYEYEIYGDKILKINLQTGKVKKIKIKSAKKVNNDVFYYPVIEHKNYLYYTVDSFGGTSSVWNYICRVKTNGSGFKVLGKGENPQIVNNQIYYTKKSFTEKQGGDDTDGEIGGVYKMRLNGTKKEKIIDKYALFFVYKNKLYVRPKDNVKYGEILRCSLNGKIESTVVNGTETYVSWNRAYVSDGILYYDASIWSNIKRKYDYGYVAVDLENNIVNYHASKGEFAGVDKKYLYFGTSRQVKGKWKGTLYYQKKGSDKVKKFSKEVYSPIICSNSSRPYIVASVGRKTVDGSNLVIFNLKKKKVKKIAGW